MITVEFGMDTVGPGVDNEEFCMDIAEFGMGTDGFCTTPLDLAWIMADSPWISMDIVWKPMDLILINRYTNRYHQINFKFSIFSIFF